MTGAAINGPGGSAHAAQYVEETKMWPFKKKRWGGVIRVIEHKTNSGEITYSVEVKQDLTWDIRWVTLYQPPLTLDEATKRADIYYQKIVTERIVAE